MDALAVREILWLPELTPLDEAPRYVAGVLNLRGHLVPVIDLHRRFGRAGHRYSTRDSVLVLEWEGQRAGVIVSQVLSVRDMADSETEMPPGYGLESDTGERFLCGLAKVDQAVVMMLDLERLLRLPEDL